MTLIQYSAENGATEIAGGILALEDAAWPANRENKAFPSAPDTYVTSFVWLKHDAAICHVGIRKSTLFHKGQAYLAYGLSEVVTHPCYRRQGIASRTIRIAAQFILDQHPDISIFTCEKSKVPFYAQGGWEEVKGACFVGGTKEKPLRSDGLDLATMMRFISPHAALHRADFEKSDLVFDLGENQLW